MDTKILRTFTVPCHDCEVEFTVQRDSLAHCPQRCPGCRRRRKVLQRQECREEQEEAGTVLAEPSEECKALLREIRAYVAHGYALRDQLRASCNAWARENGFPEYRPPPLFH